MGPKNCLDSLEPHDTVTDADKRVQTFEDFNSCLICVFSGLKSLKLISHGSSSVLISVLWTLGLWQNSIGGTSASTGGHFNEPYVLVTIPIYQKLNADIVLRITMYKMFTRCLHRDKYESIYYKNNKG